MATVNETMTALANEVRELSGTTTEKGIVDMTLDVSAANTEITEQTELIAQIIATLEGKVSNGSSSEDVTAEVNIYTAKIAELEATIAELEKALGIESNIELLEGDGQEFYTMAPSTLLFRSTAPLEELRDVTINGKTVDPSNYELEEGSTIVKLKHDYLSTLDTGKYELAIVSNNKTAKGEFTVAAPELNEYGFYYNIPYVFTVPVDEDGNTTDIGFVFNDHVSEANVRMGYMLTIDGGKGVFTYTIDGTLILVTVVSTQETMELSIDNNMIAIEGFGQATLNHSAFCSDGGNIYVLTDDGYVVSHVQAAYATTYTPIKSNILGTPVKHIADYAYVGLKGTWEMYLPEGIVDIGYEAFADTTVHKIHIPTTLRTISPQAFRENLGEMAVYIKDIAAWLNIDFEDDSSNPLNTEYSRLTYLYLNNELVTELDIPQGVTSIKPYVFVDYDKLTRVTIPTSVSNIGADAFYACPNLADVVFEGTTAQWAAIGKDDGWYSSEPATYVQCSDGQVAL